MKLVWFAIVVVDRYNAGLWFVVQNKLGYERELMGSEIDLCVVCVM